jgi:hypothetical protein
MSGPFGAGALNFFSGAAEFYPYTIDQSARFNDNDSAYLSKLWGSAGNQQTFTYSFWIKRANIGSRMDFISFQQDVPIAFNSDTIRVFLFGADRLITSAQFRDVSAWYHIVLTVDSTDATSGDRIKLYVNGERQTDFSTESYPSLNANANIYTGGLNQYIGRLYGGSNYFDGYVADMYYLDGIVADASSFGETKAGIWIPKDYTGSYGTNGFKLAFQDSASLGDDTSGNGNDFTANNLAASDQMLDTPTSNFPTMNKLWQSKGTWTTAEGNLQNTWSANDYQSGIATMGLPATGKWYWEIYLKSRTYTNWLYWNLIIADYAEGSGNNGNSASQWSDHYFSLSAERSDTGYLAVSSGSTNSIASSGIYDTGNVIQVAFDADNKRLYLGDSGTWFLSADPGAESGDGTAVWYNWSDDAQGKLFPAVDVNYLTYVDVHNFGQDSTFAGNLASGGNADANGIGDFKYSVPSGYLALCAANLPAPGIDPAEDEAPTDYFNTVLYSGNSSTNNITGVGFQPDWVWIKVRNATGQHSVFDAVRGATKRLGDGASGLGTAVESTVAASLQSFDSDGFTFGAEAGNNSGENYVAWSWKAGGTAVSNTDGSITSSVSASPESGFSIVTYTGDSDVNNETVGHGLGVAPKVVILKPRTEARHWLIWHHDFNDNDKALLFNLDPPADNRFGPNAPTANVFGVYAGQGNRNGTDFVAYCFADIDGMVKAGSHVGNGSTDGPFLYTGFRPAFVIFKRTDTTSNWSLYDAAREPTNVNDSVLYANTNDAEIANNSTVELDFVSNGIKLRDAPNQFNVSGATYVYLAFAEQPFKYANAR